MGIIRRGGQLTQEIRSAAVTNLRTAWGFAGTLLIFITPIVTYYTTPYTTVILPIAVLFIVAALLFLVWLSSYVWRTYLTSASMHVTVPDVDTVVYSVFPYRADSHLRELSVFADKVFKGDTMNAAIVQYAVDSGCAAGMRLTNPSGEDAGFFDVFRLNKDALSKWLDGRLSEPEFKQSDFEPLTNQLGSQTTLELIVGAIYIDPATRKEEPGLAFQFADLAEEYLWKACSGWDEVRLYSSIFSGEGQRLASLYGFSKSIYMKDRQGAAARHDVWARTLRRSDPPRVIRGLGGRHNVVMEMKLA